MFRKLLAAALVASCPALAQVAPAPAPHAYILNGYRLSGAKGVDEDAMIAKLPHHAGERITEADIKADTATLGATLKAQHIDGQLFATMAVKNGRVWVLFDLQNLQVQQSSPVAQRRWLGSQIFDGNSKISSAALQSATGLKPGDDLPVERLNAARQAIIEAYRKAAPGADVHVGGKMHITPEGKVEVTWHITEPK